MKNKVLKAAALLLFLAAAAAAQVHDIEVAREYSQSIGGIRLSYGNVTIMDDTANLTAGRLYEIRYKIRNLGDFSEKANISVLVSNLTRTWVINHRSRTVDAKKSIYLSEKWDTSDLCEGAYWVMVHAMVSEDSNVSNDNRTRNVTLWGHAAATTTSTSRTTTSRSSTSSSTSTTTMVEDEEDTTTSTTRKTTTTSSSTKDRTASTSAAVQPSSTSKAELLTTTLRTMTTRTTSTQAALLSSSTTTTPSGTIANAATGNAVGMSSDGRQMIVVFLVLVAGAVLYLSRK